MFTIFGKEREGTLVKICILVSCAKMPDAQVEMTFNIRSIQIINKVILRLLKRLLLKIVRIRVIKRMIPIRTFLNT